MNDSRSPLNGPTSPDLSQGYTWIPPGIAGRKNGCFNRPAFAPYRTLYAIAQNTGQPISVTIANRLSQDCRYSFNDVYGDPGCDGCIHNQRGEKV